ncbi:MAG: hypothetical protein QG620_173 [Patescibacteria group bacterium]|nr:hypothetical protein [Patescibacteria group bacterium]
MSTLKKIFFLSIFIFVLSLLFWGVYNLSFKKTFVDETPKETEAPDEIKNVVPPKETPAIIAVFDEPAISPVLSADGNAIRYYSKTNGQAWEISLDGTNKKIIGDTELAGLADVYWSADKNKVITRFNKIGEKVAFFYYNYAENKGVKLKDNLDEVAWNTNGNKILYKYYSPASQERTLNIADPDGTSWQKLADLKYRYVNIAQIPMSGLISFWNRPDAYTETLLQTVPAIGGEEKTVFTGKFGADYLWNNSGTHTLVSHSDIRMGNRMQLATINYNGGEYKNLNIPTFVSKCLWSKDQKTIYYALPGNIPENSILPNDYDEGKFTTTDTFWKVNLENGEKTRLVETENIPGKFDVAKMFLNSDESILFFTNKIDGELYRIDL